MLLPRGPNLTFRTLESVFRGGHSFHLVEEDELYQEGITVPHWTASVGCQMCPAL